MPWLGILSGSSCHHSSILTCHCLPRCAIALTRQHIIRSFVSDAALGWLESEEAFVKHLFINPVSVQTIYRDVISDCGLYLD
jgi:hypothetical protein